MGFKPRAQKYKIFVVNCQVWGTSAGIKGYSLHQFADKIPLYQARYFSARRRLGLRIERQPMGGPYQCFVNERIYSKILNSSEEGMPGILYATGARVPTEDYGALPPGNSPLVPLALGEGRANSWLGDPEADVY